MADIESTRSFGYRVDSRLCQTRYAVPALGDGLPDWPRVADPVGYMDGKTSLVEANSGRLVYTLARGSIGTVGLDTCDLQSRTVRLAGSASSSHNTISCHLLSSEASKSVGGRAGTLG